MPNPIIAVTMGDPGGIGPEVIAKSFQAFKYSDKFFYLLIGATEVFDSFKKKFKVAFPLNLIPALHPQFLRKNAVNFLDIKEEASKLLEKKGKKLRLRKFSFDIGKVSLANAAVAYASIKAAAYQAAQGLVQAVVTAPVNKTAIRLIEPNFHGHTEYLAKVARVKSFAMMFVSDRLRVTLATIHVPLKNVSRMITEELVFEKIKLTDQFLKTHLKVKKPKIAVCALNPHGRETGEEEDRVISPAVSKAQRQKIRALGPLSADQLFYDAYEGRYDAVISMYHDQGLTPFKMIAFKDGVNVTLGLPYIRTSPDHGTAFDIAYQGKADPSSMKAAFRLAEKLL